MHVYVGSYTRDGGSDGIYVYELDAASGRLRPIQRVPDIDDPSYLAFGPGGRTLYAVSERPDDGGWVVAFAVETSTGRLSVLNRVASHGAEPAHLSLDASGRWLLVANYSGGTIASLPIGSDGRLGEAADVVRHTGHGPRADRQEGPHPHMVLPDPGGAFVLVVDLGLDAVLGYRLDPTSGRLVAQPDAGCRVAAGAGPRHLAFSADGRYAYVLNELDSTLVACAYTAASGQLRPLQTVSTLPDGFSGPENYPAAVVVAPSGRFVYASNRGHDSLAIFAIDQASGRLTALGHTPIGGRWPRDISLDPSGTWLLAANQKSDQVTTFHVDPATGAVEPTDEAASVSKPTRVLVAHD